MDYIAARYGSPANAWAHEVRYGWYDGGGGLPPGYTLAYNGTGRTETIRTAEQESSLQRSFAGLTGFNPAGMPGYGAAAVTGSGIDYDRLAEALARVGGNRYTAQVANYGPPMTAQKLMNTFREMEFLSGP